ncbi:ATP synthase subunit g, mitochondrial-like [Ruditapes philippinarum]|uniref:ATP synthase subunit g, mitochondrial-like n=1 Tax=Ruditapes philippinarum TaxID=129788 RepID=UPI00295AF894|nr:ATP synthase subunit g, mitochondrial-like [Ruditapes philippinarum]
MAFVGRMAVRMSNGVSRTSNYMGKKWPIVKKYAVVELAPPTPAEVERHLGSLQVTNKHVYMFFYFQQATLNTVVMFEVILWFFVGECIGKRSYVGYPVKVPNAVHKEISYT